MSLFDRLPHRVDVHGPQESATDDGAGVVVTWDVVRDPNVPCLLNWSAAGVQDRFGQDQLVGSVSVAFNRNATVGRGDMLVVVGGWSDGKRMRVVSINPIDSVGGIPDFLMASCEVIR